MRVTGLRLALTVLALMFAAAGPGRVVAQTPQTDPTASPVPVLVNGQLQPAAAQCEDGWWSYEDQRPLVCAGHGGVMLWIYDPESLPAIRATWPGGAPSLSAAVESAPIAAAPPAAPAETAAAFTFAGAGPPIVVRLIGVSRRLTSPNRFNVPVFGGFTILELDIKNLSLSDFVLNPYEFQIQTADGLLWTEGNAAGFPLPRLDYTVLGPGHDEFGYETFDLPPGEDLSALVWVHGLDQPFPLLPIPR